MSAIAVLGANGLLGPHISEAFQEEGHSVFPLSRSSECSIDVTNPASVKEVLADLNPDVVINLVALTNVDQCENSPEEAESVNALSVQHIVENLSKDTYFVHVSTDQVYSGNHDNNHEADVNPINVYGKTKLKGEQFAQEFNQALILRSNIFGPSKTGGRQSLSDFFVDAFTHHKPATLFQDIYFSPLHMRTYARLLRKLVNEHRITGVYNFGSQEGVSKAAFAQELANHLGLSTAAAAIGNSSDIKGRAPRPKDLRMNVDKFMADTGIELPSLKEEVAKL